MVLCNQLRVRDLKDRRGRFIDLLPAHIMEEVLAKLATLIEQATSGMGHWMRVLTTKGRTNQPVSLEFSRSRRTVAAAKATGSLPSKAATGAGAREAELPSEIIRAILHLRLVGQACWMARLLENAAGPGCTRAIDLSQPKCHDRVTDSRILNN